MNEEPHNPSIEPELEARIVALLLGEASDSERDQLNRQIERRPELASFKVRMQKMHGMLQDAAVGEFEAPDEDWKLPTDRRNAVLAVIRGEATIQPAVQEVDRPVQIRVPVKLRLPWNLTKVVAVVCVAGFIGVMALQSFSFRTQERAASEYFYEAAKADEPRYGFSSFSLQPESAREDLVKRSSVVAFDQEPLEEQLLAQSASGSIDYKKSSELALLALRGTLENDATVLSHFGLEKDVRAIAGNPGLMMPEETAAQYGTSTMETRARAAATFESGPGSSPQAAGLNVFFGRNDVDFPVLVGGRDKVSDPAPAAEVHSSVPAPVRGSVSLGEINARSSGESAPMRGEMETATPRIIIGAVEEQVDKVTLDLPVLGWAYRLPELPQQQGQTEFLSPTKPSADFLKDQTGPGIAGNKIDGEQFWHEGEPTDSLSLARTRDGSGMAESKLSDLLSDAVDGLGTTAQDFGGFGDVQSGGSGGGMRGLNRGRFSVPSMNWGRENPADARGYGTQIPEGIPLSDFGALAESSRPEDSGLDSMARMKSAVDSAGTESLESLQQELARPSVEPSASTSVPMALNGEVAQSGKSEIVVNDVKLFDQWENRGDKPNSDDRWRDRVDVDDGFRVDDGVANAAKEGRQLEVPGESDGKESVRSYFQKFDVAPTLNDDLKPAKKPVAKTAAPSVGLNETTAAAEAFSTFSLHVSDVSFKLAAAALARGEWPEAAQVRIEEFLNAFDYGDPMPSNGERVTCVVEQSIHPFVQQRNLLRVSMRTAAEGRASNTPLRLTLLLDNSGSMERPDRQDTVRRAFTLLSQQLSPMDQVTLISFARQPRLLAEKVSGAESGQLVKLIDELPSEGGTNIEGALRLAFEKATEQQTAGAQNRIILLTDGAVNLGDADPERLSRMVTTMRDAGIAFDAAGISAEGLNDEVLEALTRKGDGRYYVLGSLEDADETFARQVAGALRPSASNVKVQVEFNPKRVGHYKLLGFEKHILKQEDFRDDAVDAAEMAAAEAGVAMYQFEARPDGEGDVGSVSVRFRDLSTGQMVENRWPIPYEADAPRPDQAAPSLRIATSAALLAAKLRGEPSGETVDLPTLSNLISGLPEQDQHNSRVQQLKLMIEQARQLSGK